MEGLYAANDVMNLTRVPREEAWVRHFADSLLFADLIPVGSAVLDIGTGPGFPAWPLACARPDLQVTALDSNRKMLGFLRGFPLLNLECELARAEEWGHRGAYEVVTGRAVALLPIQLEISAAPCRIGGCVIPMRTGRDEFGSVRELGLELEKVEERVLPGTEIARVFPVYRKVKKTPARYPRRWADIKAKPLSFGA